jgi:hypothetical protein
MTDQMTAWYQSTHRNLSQSWEMLFPTSNGTAALRPTVVSMDEERSSADKLSELQQLHDDGLITDDEFAERRSAILDQITAAPSPLPSPEASTTSKSGTPGRWTAQEQAAYKAANPKKGMATETKVALGIVAIIGTVVLIGYLANGETSNTSQTFAEVAESLDGNSYQLAVDTTLKGTGEKSTNPFQLNGDYAVVIRTSGDCYYAFDIDRTSDGHTQESLGSHDGEDDTATRIYAVPSGSYFIDVITGPSPSCPWTVTIKG